MEWAVVHDAARVLTTRALIEKVMAAAQATGAAAAASKMSDTVRATDGGGKILRLVDREGLWRMETPQVVRAEVLRKGLTLAREKKVVVTDCLAAAELAGVKGVLVESFLFHFHLKSTKTLPYYNVYPENEMENFSRMKTVHRMIES